MKKFSIFVLVLSFGFFGGEVWATTECTDPQGCTDNTSAQMNVGSSPSAWWWSSSNSSAPSSASCNFDPSESSSPGAIAAALRGCKPRGMIETKSGSYVFETDVRKRVIDIANQLILIGSILSVGVIVYAGILYIIAVGDDERIKSAKNALKFGIIGFAVMLISFGLINAIVRLFYATGG